MKSFHLSTLSDNPNLRINRLDYLQDVDGIVSLDDVYEASQVAALRRQRKPVSIDLQGFDAFITCCPLNLRPINTPVFVQTVHDLIALEYVPHNENVRQFTHRLQACLQRSEFTYLVPRAANSTTTSMMIRLRGHLAEKTSWYSLPRCIYQLCSGMLGIRPMTCLPPATCCKICAHNGQASHQP